RRVRARVLLMEDDLLGEAQPASAVLDRPADAGPPGRRHVPVPLQPLLEHLVLAAGSAATAQVGEASGQVLLEPSSDLGPELRVLRGVCPIHPVLLIETSWPAARCSRIVSRNQAFVW